jgi:hypothetical protein
MSVDQTPITKKDLEAAIQSMLAAFDGMRTEIAASARGQAARLNTAETALADLAIRIAALEDRILNLESRRRVQ